MDAASCGSSVIQEKYFEPDCFHVSCEILLFHVEKFPHSRIFHPFEAVLSSIPAARKMLVVEQVKSREHLQCLFNTQTCEEFCIFTQHNAKGLGKKGNLLQHLYHIKYAHIYVCMYVCICYSIYITCLFTLLVDFFTTCLAEFHYLHSYIIFSSVTGSLSENLNLIYVHV
jgi:hypothetical protein